MIEQVLHALWAQTLVLSATVVVIGCARRAIARRFGAEAAYFAWALVPVGALAAALPHRAQEAPLLPATLVQRLPAWPTVVPTSPPLGGFHAAEVLFVGWALVAVLLLVAIAWIQRRFHAQLSGAGRLPAGQGPAVLGIVRPRLVLPADFEARFDESERDLMLAHEAVHLRRRDNAWSLLACAIVVAHWFNPLAWLAWRWMRFDQELSCDAAVLGGAPAPRVQAYAAALFKVQGITLRPILGTSWQSVHPLVDRVRMLERHALFPSGRRAGRGVVVGAIVLGGAVSYASQPPSPAVPSASPAGSYTTFLDDGHISTQVTLIIDGLPPRYTELGDGKQGRIRFQAQPEVGLADWIDLRVHAQPLDGGGALISSVIRDEATAKVLGEPQVMTRMNESSLVELDNVGGHHTLTIIYLPRAAGYVPPHADTPAPASPAPAPAAGTDQPSVMTAVVVTDTTPPAPSSDGVNKSVIHATFSMRSHLGEQAIARLAEAAHQWPGNSSLEIGLTVTRLDGDRLQIDARVNGSAPPAVTGRPRLVVHEGERADVRLKSDDGSHDISISFLPRVLNGPEAASAVPVSALPQRAP